MTDTKQSFTAEEVARLIVGLGQFLQESCKEFNFTDEDRGELAGRIAHWMLSDKVMVLSPEKILPKARYRLAFNVVDESVGEHIIRLVLDRTKEMTDGDFMQLQNFFWCTVGRAIRDNPEIIRTLQAGGIRVETDPSSQPAPGGMCA